MTSYHLPGLSDEEKFGYNLSATPKKNTWYTILLDILKEPMLILLTAVALIYVIVSNYSKVIFMLGAIIAVSGISLYPDNRSKNPLEALERLNEPLSTVIRNSQVMQIPTHEIAVGDLCIVTEGKTVNARICVKIASWSTNTRSRASPQ